MSFDPEIEKKEKGLVRVCRSAFSMLKTNLRFSVVTYAARSASDRLCGLYNHHTCSARIRGGGAVLAPRFNS